MHSALPPASRIELQCIFVDTLLTGKIGFRGDHVSPVLDFGTTPHKTTDPVVKLPQRLAMTHGQQRDVPPV